MTAQGDSAAFEGDNVLILYSSTNVYTCNTLPRQYVSFLMT